MDFPAICNNWFLDLKFHLLAPIVFTGKVMKASCKLNCNSLKRKKKKKAINNVGFPPLFLSFFFSLSSLSSTKRYKLVPLLVNYYLSRWHCCIHELRGHSETLEQSITYQKRSFTLILRCYFNQMIARDQIQPMKIFVPDIYCVEVRSFSELSTN